MRRGCNGCRNYCRRSGYCDNNRVGNGSDGEIMWDEDCDKVCIWIVRVLLIVAFVMWGLS